MESLVPGTIVVIENLKYKSWFLYKKYKEFSEFMVCPCHLKDGTLLTIVDIIEDKVILRGYEDDSILTMTYIEDLAPVYE